MTAMRRLRWKMCIIMGLKNYNSVPKEKTYFENARDSIRKEQEKHKIKGLLGGKDFQRKKVYRWERELFYQAKIISKKAYIHKETNNLFIQNWSIARCKVFLNKIIKREFSNLTSGEKLDSRYESFHSRILSMNKLIYNNIQPIWNGKSYAEADKLYSHKGVLIADKYTSNEEKYILWNQKTFREETDFKGKLTNHRLQKWMDDWREELPLFWFGHVANEVRTYGKDRVKIFYYPEYVGMNLPPEGRNKPILLHELSHLLSYKYAHHGPRFVSVLMYLYNKYLKISFDLIIETAENHKIKYDKNHSFIKNRL